MKNQSPSGIERDVFTTLKRISRWVQLWSVFSICLSAFFLITSILLITVGRGKDRIIVRDASGRPYLLVADRPDIIDRSELDAFVRSELPQVFEWTYTEIQDREMFRRRIYSLLPYFDQNFFKKSFWPVFKVNYLSPILKKRLIVKAYFDQYKDRKVRGDKAVVLAVFKLHVLSVSGGDTSGEYQKKTYVIKIKKGRRSVENPYGLYVVGLYEYSD